MSRLTSDIAYADTPLSDLEFIPKEFKASQDKEMVKRPTNYTCVSRTERTSKIIANWKVAPLYATASLLARWSAKCLTVPLLPISYFTQIFQKGMLQSSARVEARESKRGLGYSGKDSPNAEREAR